MSRELYREGSSGLDLNVVEELVADVVKAALCQEEALDLNVVRLRAACRAGVIVLVTTLAYSPVDMGLIRANFLKEDRYGPGLLEVFMRISDLIRGRTRDIRNEGYATRTIDRWVGEAGGRVQFDYLLRDRCMELLEWSDFGSIDESLHLTVEALKQELRALLAAMARNLPDRTDMAALISDPYQHEHYLRYYP